jgi:hypothetical protein
LHEKVISQVEFEIGQIDHLLETYAGLLLEAQQSTPNLVEITALAAVMHSFYNGLENVLLSIAKGLDSATPTGTQWHRDLLTQITQPTPSRGPVLTADTAHRLADYLGFRHFYRHSYSFVLDWEELRPLVVSLKQIWEQSKYELYEFLSRLRD